MTNTQYNEIAITLAQILRTLDRIAASCERAEARAQQDRDVDQAIGAAQRARTDPEFAAQAAADLEDLIGSDRMRALEKANGVIPASPGAQRKRDERGGKRGGK